MRTIKRPMTISFEMIKSLRYSESFNTSSCLFLNAHKPSVHIIVLLIFASCPIFTLGARKKRYINFTKKMMILKGPMMPDYIHLDI
jgi:hypothetical protein